MFGSTPATSVDIVSESEITAVSPPGEGTVNVTVRIYGVGESRDVEGDLFSYPSQPVITTASLAEGQLGTPYSQMLAATGGPSPYTWTLSSGSLPEGRPLAAASSSSATRGAQTAPWNVEAICAVHEHEKVTVIKIGVPTGAPESKSGCESAEAEASEADAEVAGGEGCYASSPAPQGCVDVLVINPVLGLEVSYGGTLRARVINGAGNGLDQSQWTMPGSAVDELRCQAPAGCAAGTMSGELKVQGYEAVQLIQEK